MPSEGRFGIRYDMDFLPPLFPSIPFIAILSPPPVQIVLLSSRMGLLPLAVFNTALACFLIIFPSLRWHWFMRVMLDTPPRPAPSTNPHLFPLNAQFLSLSLKARWLLLVSSLWHHFFFFPSLSDFFFVHLLLPHYLHHCSLSHITLWLYWMANELPSW